MDVITYSCPEPDESAANPLLVKKKIRTANLSQERVRLWARLSGIILAEEVVNEYV